MQAEPIRGLAQTRGCDGIAQLCVIEQRASLRVEAAYQVPSEASGGGTRTLLGNDYADELVAEEPFLVATLPLNGGST